jgi:flagellar biosynthesis protein FlhF
MFVKKFEADTLDEALKSVKKELGPDAIILKTVTNKGLKGAFKKKKFEITAAISERNYTKKSNVDKVMSNDQKDDFYKHSSASISEAYETYDRGNKKMINNVEATVNNQTNASYGQLGLNRVVNSITKGTTNIKNASAKTSSILKNSLDDFLNTSEESMISEDELMNDSIDEESINRRVNQNLKKAKVTAKASSPESSFQNFMSEDNDIAPKTIASTYDKEQYNELKQEMKNNQNKIKVLENRIVDLVAKIENESMKNSDAQGVFALRTFLKTLEVDDKILTELIKKSTYELSKEDLEDEEVVFEFALKELAASVKTRDTLFSSFQDGSPVVTVLVGGQSSGQSTMALKFAIQQKESVYIRYVPAKSKSTIANLATQVFGLKVENVGSFGEVLSIVRKQIEKNCPVIVDLKLADDEIPEAKRMIDTIKRGTKNTEVLVSISAIHSELFNRKILARYKDFGDGVIISHVDLCVNYGAIFNLHRAFQQLPLVYFGTGAVVPDDGEPASAERLMAGMFKFN